MAKIGIDADDTIYPLIPQLCLWYNSYYGKNFKIKDFIVYELWKIWGGKREEAYARVIKFFQSTFSLQTEPIKDAQEVLNRLRGKHQLYIITARENGTEEMTYVWLRLYFPDYFEGIHFVKNNPSGGYLPKSALCKMLEIDVLVDDHPKNVLECSQAGMRYPILFGRYPWNQADDLPGHILRVDNWLQVESVLADLS